MPDQETVLDRRLTPKADDGACDNCGARTRPEEWPRALCPYCRTHVVQCPKCSTESLEVALATHIEVRHNVPTDGKWFCPVCSLDRSDAWRWVCERCKTAILACPQCRLPALKKAHAECCRRPPATIPWAPDKKRGWVLRKEFARRHRLKPSYVGNLIHQADILEQGFYRGEYWVRVRCPKKLKARLAALPAIRRKLERGRVTREQAERERLDRAAARVTSGELTPAADQIEHLAWRVAASQQPLPGALDCAPGFWSEEEDEEDRWPDPPVDLDIVAASYALRHGWVTSRWT